MIPQPTACDPRRIEACLGDALGDDERAEFEAHLEACPACRTALQRAAAQPSDWQAVRNYLSTDASIPLAHHEDGVERVHGEGSASQNSAADADPAQLEAIDSVLMALAPTDDPHMLGRLGGYEIAGVVGRGGMGVVLKALDPALNRFVAIKVLAPQLATSGAARQRFAREARAAASVVHENVVAIHAVADSGPLPYFVMPYLRGSSLQKRLDCDGPLGTAEILRVAIQIAAGLSAAHAQGLVHRDIKPANILLEDGVERLKITDFGLARAADDASLTRTGVIAGTPQFMSPEQARGELVDSRSDLFSLGSVMYAMCTARPPFRSETSYGTLQRICDAVPRSIREINPEIPSWLTAFVGRLHDKNPDERWQTAREVAVLLEQCLAHLRQPDAVPLPHVVASLQELSERTTQQDAKSRRAARLFSSESPRPWRRAASQFISDHWRPLGLGAAAVLIGVAVWALTGRSTTSDATDSKSGAASVVAAGPAEPANPSEAQTAPATLYRPEREFDGDVSQEIQDLEADISRLESRLSALERSLPKAKEEKRGPSPIPHTPSNPPLQEPKP